LRVVYSQRLSDKDRVSYQRYEETDISLNEYDIKCWAARILERFYQTQTIFGVKCFNLKVPIMVEIYVDSTLKYMLMQKRVTNDTIIRPIIFTGWKN
jgi:hypothetical protein